MNQTQGTTELFLLIAAASGLPVAMLIATPDPAQVADPVGLVIAAVLGASLRASVLLNQRRLKHRDVAIGDLLLTAFASAFSVIVYRWFSTTDPFGWNLPRTLEITWAVAMLAGFAGGSVVFRSSWKRWENTADAALTKGKDGDSDET